MPLFGIVMIAALLGFVVVAVVVQVRARRAERRAIARSEESVTTDAPDPMQGLGNDPLLAQFHERTRWRPGGP